MAGIDKYGVNCCGAGHVNAAKEATGQNVEKEAVIQSVKREAAAQDEPRRFLRGSYTVEAALLMGILLPLFVGIIYLGFYLHDCAFLKGAAYETAGCASLHLEDEKVDIPSAAAALASHRTLGTTGVTAGVTVGEKEAEAVYQGSFPIPGMTAQFFGAGAVNINKRMTLSTERPSKKIQKIRGAAKIIDTIRRKRE